jgi:pyruvate/2-oxoglutarate dehydrogenase complex dihydrolipoamide acyltransferase (E2) component
VRIRIVAVDIIFPKLGFSMNEGVLAEWLAQDGSTVSEGQPLFSLESDKSTNEVESPASGVLQIIGQAGETFEVGAIIGTIA